MRLMLHTQTNHKGFKSMLAHNHEITFLIHVSYMYLIACDDRPLMFNMNMIGGGNET